MNRFIIFVCVICFVAWLYLLFFPETFGIKVEERENFSHSPFRYIPSYPLEVVEHGRSILVVNHKGEVYLEGVLVGYSESLRDELKGKFRIITKDY